MRRELRPASQSLDAESRWRLNGRTGLPRACKPHPPDLDQEDIDSRKLRGSQHVREPEGFERGRTDGEIRLEQHVDRSTANRGSQLVRRPSPAGELQCANREVGGRVVRNVETKEPHHALLSAELASRSAAGGTQ